MSPRELGSDDGSSTILLDRAGHIVALSRGFERHGDAHEWRPDVWVGRHVSALLHDDPAIVAWLADVFASQAGAPTAPSHRWHTRDSSGQGRWYDVHRAQPVGDAASDGAILLLFVDVTASTRQEQQNLAVDRMRRELWRAPQYDDEGVLAALHEGLVELGVSFDACGVNIVDRSSDPPVARQYHARRDEGWEQGLSEAESTEIVIARTERAEASYRRDVLASDDPSEASPLSRSYGYPVRSVVDVPFQHGTLAVNSRRPDAFTDGDVEALTDIAAALSEAFARREDTERLERQGAELAEKDRLVRSFERVGETLLATLDVEEILDALAVEMVRAGLFRSLMVAVVNHDEGVVEVVRAFAGITVGGAEAPRVRGTRYALDDANITAEVARTGRLAVLTGWDDRFDSRFDAAARYPADKVAYFIPVKKGEETLAVLATGSDRAEKQEVLRRIDSISSLLTQAAIALDHARLYQQMKAAHSELQTVIDGANCVLWRADVALRDGKMEWEVAPVDEEAAQRVLPVETRPGEDWEAAADRARFPEDARRMLLTGNTAMLAGDRRYTQEFRGIDRSGNLRWVHEDVFVEPRGEDRWYLIGVLTDVTQRKQAEKIKEEFVSTVSHELRTPLTSILGALDLVVAGTAGDVAAQQLSLLTIAADNSHRLAQLVDDILDLSGLEAGHIAVELQTLELAPLVRTAIEANEPYATNLGVSLVFDGRAPGARVDVDPGRFAQLMANLLSNAAKFSPGDGRVTIATRAGDNWARISVSDNGPGIPESEHGQLFQRFTQVDSSSTRGHGGTGLGLAIAKTIVERMAGRIGLTSEVGVGTTFFVDLPTRPVEPG